MAGFRTYTRLVRRGLSSKTAQVTGVFLLIVFIGRFVLLNNWDLEETPLLYSPKPVKSAEDKDIDWSKFKYVQYVTTPEYLCNALMIWSSMEEIGSRANRIMMHPAHWSEMDVEPINMQPTPIARLLSDAVDKYFVKLYPVEALSGIGTDEETWAESYTKLLAFNLTEFDRVLVIDSDSVLRGNLDDLFLLPPASLAMPQVYWGEPHGWQHSNQLMLIQPSVEEFSKIETAISVAKEDEYDIDIINQLYKGQIMNIPQRPYDLLSGEFRRQNHKQYLGSTSEIWDPEKILSEAKFMHFSDWPIPKPWIRAPKDLLNKNMPRCQLSRLGFGASDCKNREIWLKLYFDFAVQRMSVCGAGFELQSQELPPDSIYRDGKWFHPDELG